MGGDTAYPESEAQLWQVLARQKGRAAVLFGISVTIKKGLLFFTSSYMQYAPLNPL